MEVVSATVEELGGIVIDRTVVTGSGVVATEIGAVSPSADPPAHEANATTEHRAMAPARFRRVRFTDTPS